MNTKKYVQQNQGSQGHGQGYLGSLKALSPELIQDVTIINGPFSAEYGDSSLTVAPTTTLRWGSLMSPEMAVSAEASCDAPAASADRAIDRSQAILGPVLMEPPGRNTRSYHK
jgi:hypothetical protein